MKLYIIAMLVVLLTSCGGGGGGGGSPAAPTPVVKTYVGFWDYYNPAVEEMVWIFYPDQTFHFYYVDYVHNRYHFGSGTYQYIKQGSTMFLEFTDRIPDNCGYNYNEENPYYNIELDSSGDHLSADLDGGTVTLQRIYSIDNSILNGYTPYCI